MKTHTHLISQCRQLTHLEIPAYKCPESVIFSKYGEEWDFFLPLQLWAAVIVHGLRAHTGWVLCFSSSLPAP